MAATSLGEMDTREIILKHVAPGIGCIVAFVMFISPLKAVLGVRNSKHLGDLNPLPLVAIIANCTGWLLYGCINQDIYVILANEPGLMLGLFMTVSCYGFADPKVRENMLRAVLFFAALLSLSGITSALFIQSKDERSAVAGYTAVFILLCYYAAPLSTMAEVFKTRSSASLYWPLSIMSCINGSLWVAYALAIHDSFIFYPNLVGAIFGVIQIVLIQIYPSKSAGASPQPHEYQPLQGQQETV